MDAKDRLQAFLIRYNLNANKLANEIGVPKYRLYNITQGRIQSIPYEIADKIKSHYPTISREWLISGEGEMLLPDTKERSDAVCTTGTTSTSTTNTADLLEQIRDLQSQNKKLIEIIERLTK